MTIQDAKNQISYLPVDGPVSHNIASCILRKVAAEHGKSAANDIIIDLGLEETYGIKPVAERAPEGQTK